jgi:hypothetical protein
MNCKEFLASKGYTGNPDDYEDISEYLECNGFKYVECVRLDHYLREDTIKLNDGSEITVSIKVVDTYHTFQLYVGEERLYLTSDHIENELDESIAELKQRLLLKKSNE